MNMQYLELWPQRRSPHLLLILLNFFVLLCLCVCTHMCSCVCTCGCMETMFSFVTFTTQFWDSLSLTPVLTYSTLWCSGDLCILAKPRTGVTSVCHHALIVLYVDAREQSSGSCVWVADALWKFPSPQHSSFFHHILDLPIYISVRFLREPEMCCWPNPKETN